MNKYAGHLTNDELLKRLVDELVEMHRGTYIDLGYWETARIAVERFYRVNVILEIKGKEGD